MNVTMSDNDSSPPKNAVTIGTVISTFESPSPLQFSFVIEPDPARPIPVRKDQFISVKTEEGVLVARVTDIRKTNKYYQRAEAVREYESKTAINNIFPVDTWEFLIGDARPLGVFSSEESSTSTRIMRSTFPVSPGSKVETAPQDLLARFIGFVDNETEGGLVLGSVVHHENIPASFNMTRLVQKHIAVLAQSGAGKSYLISVLIEELLDRPKDLGRLGVLVLDIHGEYTGFALDGLYQERSIIIDGSSIKIPVPQLTSWQISEFLPKMSAAQKRDLRRVLESMNAHTKSTGETFDLADIAATVEASEEIKESTRSALASWLMDLASTKIFGPTAFPPVASLVSPGKLVIIDLSTVSGLRPKQILTAYLCRELFYMRKRGRVSPFVLVLEEAHNFVPEGQKRESAISRGILETIAREGRKFYAALCLISQRPVRLSSTILSQCNTHIVLRITNPYDLDHIGKSSEGMSRDMLNSLTTLRIGEAVVVGEAVNHPVFINVRKRKSPPPVHSIGLEGACKAFEARVARDDEDARAFI